MDLRDALKRLRQAADNRQRGYHVDNRVVRARDLQELLHQHDRLDDAARVAYVAESVVAGGRSAGKTTAMLKAISKAAIQHGHVLMRIDPTSGSVDIIANEDFELDWGKGKEMQRRLGLDVVAPRCESEIAAGQYHRLIKAAKELWDE